MKDLVQKFKFLVFIDHLSCLFSYIYGVCSCRNIFSSTIQIHDHLLIGLTLQNLIWNLISCYDIDTTWIMFYVFTLVFLFVIRCRFPKLKSLAPIVCSCYGNHELKNIRKYEKLDYRYQKLDLDIQFLDTDIWVELCPTFLWYKMSNKRLQTSDVYRRSQRLFLEEDITFKSVEKEKTRKMLSKLEVDLWSVMSFVDWIHVSNNFISCNINTIRKLENFQHYKLAKLMGSKLHHNPNQIIHHFSSDQLSEIGKSLLCKGLNFAHYHRKS